VTADVVPIGARDAMPSVRRLYHAGDLHATFRAPADAATACAEGAFGGYVCGNALGGKPDGSGVIFVLLDR
jgi:hypothetical protein